MKSFFDGVRRHIGNMDAEHLREQYRRLSDEVSSLDTLFSTIAQGIIVLDEHGEVAKSNPAARDLLGMDPEDALQMLAIPHGKSSKREIDITYPEARNLEIQTMPMGDGTLVCLRDVTAERERTEEELRIGATRAVRDLAAGVAHEIGNPLNALSLNLQLLKRSCADAVEVDECIRQVERLSGIIHGFLQALRPSKPNLVRGTMADPIKGCLKAMKPQLEERSVSVTLNLPSALPSVALDPAQMEQVFFNLMKNALEAMKDGGEMAIAMVHDDTSVSVVFRDSGAGMSDETLARLFEPYRTTKRTGTGLGLMISKRIVAAHGGEIRVASEEGKGSTFIVRLPRLEKRVRELT